MKRRLGRALAVFVIALGLVAVAAAFFLPVFKIYGSSMSPTLEKGEIVAAVKGEAWKQGDVVAFWHHNKILIKRIIAESGSTVEIGTDGIVRVDGSSLSESYLPEENGEIHSEEITCAVPENSYFVLGDLRTVTADSRNEEIGCIAKEQVIGRIVCRLWPLERIGRVR